MKTFAVILSAFVVFGASSQVMAFDNLGPDHLQPLLITYPEIGTKLQGNPLFKDAACNPNDPSDKQSACVRACADGYLACAEQDRGNCRDKRTECEKACGC
jgi:hypothetical protein